MTSHIKIDHEDLYEETLKKRNFQSKRTKTSLESEPGYQCQDIVFGEFVCNECKYTSFQRSAMIKHVAKNHAHVEMANNSNNNAAGSSRDQNANDLLSNSTEELQLEDIGKQIKGKNCLTFMN